MAGYGLIIEIERFKEKCDQLGFRLGYSKHGYHKSQLGDVVSLYPKDDHALPIFSRDAELFVGSIDDAEVWLRGIEWARDYDRMVMGKLNDKRRERKEQDYRNQELVRILTKE
jgi:hypothetical protein